MSLLLYAGLIVPFLAGEHSRVWKHLLLCLLSAWIFAATAKAALEFQADGTIVAGDYRMVLTEDTYAGIDFWKSGQVHMPQYRQSRNLVQNPGFEAGFAYWHWASLGLSLIHI